MASTEKQGPSLEEEIETTIQEMVHSLLSDGSLPPLPPLKGQQKREAEEMARRLKPVPSKPDDGENIGDWATRRFRHEMLKALALRGIPGDRARLMIDKAAKFFRKEIAPNFAGTAPLRAASMMRTCVREGYVDPNPVAQKAAVDAARAFIRSVNYDTPCTAATASGGTRGAKGKQAASTSNHSKSTTATNTAAPSTGSEAQPQSKRGSRTPPPPVPSGEGGPLEKSCSIWLLLQQHVDWLYSTAELARTSEGPRRNIGSRTPLRR